MTRLNGRPITREKEWSGMISKWTVETGWMMGPLNERREEEQVDKGREERQ